MNVETQNTLDAARLVKNSIRLFTAETISKLIALGIQIVAARYLGDKGFGTFAFGFSLTGISLEPTSPNRHVSFQTSCCCRPEARFKVWAEFPDRPESDRLDR